MEDGNGIIETARLLLRQFKTKDYKQAYQNYQSDNLTSGFMDWNRFKSSIQSLHWCCKVRKNPLIWAIILKETNEVIGSISSQKQQGIVKQGDCEDKSVYDLGYCLGSKYWGNGYMPEAAKAVLEFLFGSIEADSVMAMYDIENPRSGKVLEKIGMKHLKNVFRPHCKDKRRLTEYALYIVHTEVTDQGKGIRGDMKRIEDQK